MNIKNKIAASLMCVTMTFSLAGCSIPILSSEGASNQQIPYTAFSNQASSTEEILLLLTDAMANNETSCELVVTEEALIDAESWMNALAGIDQIHCEYRKVREGFNVVVTFQYWDNYAIVKAYETNDTSLLNERQLLLYDKYMEVIENYTSPSRSDCANELAIHDYLVTHVEYEEQEDSIYNAYDALILGKSVCSGYTEAFKTFMDLLGIENRTLSGTAGDQQHIWNMVQLDNEWYQVDVTWDDPVGSTATTADHSYFNITDEDMAIDHIWDASQNDGIQATGVRYSYPQYAGLINITSQQQLNAYIVNCINNRVSYLEFTSNDTLDLKNAMAAANITLSYSYKIAERTHYSSYVMTLNYE